MMKEIRFIILTYMCLIQVLFFEKKNDIIFIIVTVFRVFESIVFFFVLLDDHKWCPLDPVRGNSPSILIGSACATFQKNQLVFFGGHNSKCDTNTIYILSGVYLSQTIHNHLVFLFY